MDEQSFDNLTRALAGTTSRRRALGWLSGLLASSVVGVVGRLEAAAACKQNSDCPKPANRCKKAVCKPDGSCGTRSVPSGTACDDGNPCTTGTTCNRDAVCAGGTKVAHCCTKPGQCPTPKNPCQRATCQNNQCGTANRTGRCDDLDSCTANDVCTLGVCGGTRIEGCTTCQRDSDCPDPANPCKKGVCSNKGICDLVDWTDGTNCDD